MEKKFSIAFIWPPLCERFGYYRFGPRISIMSLGYLESFVSHLENIVSEQINFDKILHDETELWREMDKGGMLLDNHCIEQYIDGVLKDESYDKIYDFLLNLTDWSRFNLIAISYDLNYLKDRYAPPFYKFLKILHNTYNIKITIGGMGFPSIEVLKFYKRFPFVDYMQFGNIDSVNLETFKKIVMRIMSPQNNLGELLNAYYRDEKGAVIAKFYKEQPKASVEKQYILCPSYNLNKNNLYRSRYHDFLKFDSGFNPNFSEESIEIPVIPYRFSVGCINKCAFCMASADGKVFAFKDPEEVVNDLERLMEQNESNYFMFLNTMVNFSTKYLSELHNTMMRRNIKIKFTDSAEFHGMSREVLHILKEMGAVALWYGLECPSNRILKYINKNCTVEEAEEVLRIGDELGIWNGVNLIAGLPHEKQEDIDSTVNFINKNWPYVNMWQVTPFYLVKSRFLEEPHKYGIVIKDRYTTVDKGEGDMVMASFDEVGGVPWEVKQKKTAETFKLLLDTIDSYTQVPNLSNTTFIFYIYEKFGGNKTKIKEWLKENYHGSAPKIQVTGI